MVQSKTNKQKFKVRQPQRAARSKRPNTPSDGSKNNGIHTTKQEEYPSRHPIKRPMGCSGGPDLHLSFGGRGCTVMVQSSVPWFALGGLICI